MYRCELTCDSAAVLRPVNMNIWIYNHCVLETNTEEMFEWKNLIIIDDYCSFVTVCALLCVGYVNFRGNRRETVMQHKLEDPLKIENITETP